MKRVLILSIMFFFLLSVVSAGITFDVQPHEIYNLGDKIQTVLKINPAPEISSFVVLSLNCGERETEVYKEFLMLTEEKLKEITIPLISELINDSLGNCNLEVKTDLINETMSSDFKISNSIKITLFAENHNYAPGETILFNGSAIKENGENAWGELKGEIRETLVEEDVIDGKFSFKFYLPENFPAGEQMINLSILERSGEKIINSGNKLSMINIKQIPMNIEILLDEVKLNPGESVRGKIILHDQTGELINAEAYVAIKNEKGEIMEKIELKTGQAFEYVLNSSLLPGFWVVSAYSEEILNKLEFKINKYESIETEIFNDTLTIKNVGNVFYNKTVELKIGEEPVNLTVVLGIGETDKYLITAPEGDYQVSIGDFKRLVSLTGNAVGLEKIKDTSFGVNPLIWIFVIFVFGLMAYFIYRREHTLNYFTRKSKNIGSKINGSIPKEKENLEILKRKNLELSLSITGTKQNAIMSCISIKNYDEIKSGQGNVRETFQRINNLVEDKKGLIYTNKGNLFLIFAPSFTKTFKNQISVLELMQQIKEILIDHNKKFKVKIDFGLSMNYGAIVTKEEKENVKFMSLGTLMTVCKKLANNSNKEIYFSEKMKEEFEGKVKGQGVEIGNIKGYKLVEIMKKGDHSTFIKGFLDRQQRDRIIKNNEKK